MSGEQNFECDCCGKPLSECKNNQYSNVNNSGPTQFDDWYRKEYFHTIRQLDIETSHKLELKKCWDAAIQNTLSKVITDLEHLYDLQNGE